MNINCTCVTFGGRSKVLPRHVISATNPHRTTHTTYESISRCSAMILSASTYKAFCGRGGGLRLFKMDSIRHLGNVNKQPRALLSGHQVLVMI